MVGISHKRSPARPVTRLRLAPESPHGTLTKASAIVAALRADPSNEWLQKVHADMARTGRVHGPFKRLKVMRQSVEIRAEPPPLPRRGPYRAIVVDSPWP